MSNQKNLLFSYVKLELEELRGYKVVSVLELEELRGFKVVSVLELEELRGCKVVSVFIFYIIPKRAL